MENSETGVAIRIHPDDNVLVLRRSVQAGEVVRLEGADFALPVALGLGHKLAVRPIKTGEKIIKYGAPIGSAIRAIAVGEHVHLHNMKSDYLATYTLEEGHKYGTH